MKPFTAIGFYGSTDRVFAMHVEATDEWDAFSVARALLKDDDTSHARDVLADPTGADDRVIVEVFSEAQFVACVPGHINVTSPCDEGGQTCTAEDYPGNEEEDEDAEQ